MEEELSLPRSFWFNVPKQKTKARLNKLYLSSLNCNCLHAVQTVGP